MTYDNWKATNPADNELGPEPHDAQDELHTALAELEETGAALRAERDRLDLELQAARMARQIIERGAGDEIWRWRFTWFWAQVEHWYNYGRLDRAYNLADRQYVRDEDWIEIRDILDDVCDFEVIP